MRIVIDSNRMQSDELRAFLSISAANIAVVTDYAAMEAFKGDTLVSIQASWEVLRDFPKQVLALKGMREIGCLDFRSGGTNNQMVARDETQAVTEFPALLDRAASGEEFIQEQLLKRGQWAEDHLGKMLANFSGEPLTVEAFSVAFSETELKRMRRNEQWSEETELKFHSMVLDLAERSFAAHPDKPSWPTIKHLPNHILYRHALVSGAYMMRLVQRNVVVRKPNVARNDSVDVIFATVATYFNGLMSNDGLASEVHQLARILLSEVNARMPEDYLESYAGVIQTRLND